MVIYFSANVLKYYQALSAGSIPIHLGLTTDQFEKFKPSPNSALNVDDFKTVKGLADRVKQISNDRITFESMLAWKNLPFAERFSEIVGWGKVFLIFLCLMFSQVSQIC
jgi:hypothetical protein